MQVHDKAKITRNASAASWLAWKARKDKGRKTSISRIALRAITAPPVNGAPSRATTRRPSAILPGVAPRPLISNNTNQPLRSTKKPTSQRIARIWDLVSSKI